MVPVPEAVPEKRKQVADSGSGYRCSVAEQGYLREEEEGVVYLNYLAAEEAAAKE